MSFWGELKRRNVFKVGAAYLIAVWLIVQVVSIAFPAFHMPEWTVTFVMSLLIIGFFVALNDAVRNYLDSPAKALEELHRIYAKDIETSLDTGEISVWAAYFGDPDFALEALEKACAINAGTIEYAWAPVMREVRQLPRFKEFVREISLVDYWNESGWPDLCRPLDNDDFLCD